MRTRVLVTIFLLAIFALSSITLVPIIKPAKVPIGRTVTVSDTSVHVSNIGLRVLGDCAAPACALVSETQTEPDLEFQLVSLHPQPFQYGDTIEVEVWTTDIYESSPLTGYDLNVTYDPNLVFCKGVDYWGVFGNGTVSLYPSIIDVQDQGAPWSGDNGLLFALKFQVEFTASADHVWTKNNQNETFQLTMVDAELSFSQGDIPMSEINIPAPLPIEVGFIRGDVNCDGIVNMADLGAVAYYYGQPASVKPEYDLTDDGVINIYDLVTIATNYGYDAKAVSYQTLQMAANSDLTHSSSAFRWMDVADQTYSSSYISSYNYSQATVTMNYYNVGATLYGTLVARNLKPNFAYQLKLVGIPGTPDNEFLGLTGRWWQEEWNGSSWINGQNLNNKGDGTSPNPNDATYFAQRFITDPSSPTGYHYRYTGYLIFDYFITDSSGDATLDFQSGSCYHVLWKTSQQSPTSNDGPTRTVTFDPNLSQPAYEYDYPSSTISIFGEWERLPMGNVNPSPGLYTCQMVLTEESFHETGPLTGNWAEAMNGNMTFTIN